MVRSGFGLFWLVYLVQGVAVMAVVAGVLEVEEAVTEVEAEVLEVEEAATEVVVLWEEAVVEDEEAVEEVEVEVEVEWEVVPRLWLSLIDMAESSSLRVKKMLLLLRIWSPVKLSTMRRGSPCRSFTTTTFLYFWLCIRLSNPHVMTSLC
jgi:hypothetical protein